MTPLPLWRVGGPVALIGALAYACLAFVLPGYLPEPHFGADIYDQYYLAILDGRLDLPPRVLRLEGHYTADGTGFLYHGIAPLLTRVALGWALPIGDVSLTAFSVWLWSALGSLLYQMAALTVLARVWPEDGRMGWLWVALLSAGVWLGGPGIVLASNLSLFHEPIALAFAAGGAFVLIWTRVAMADMPLARALPLLALAAALTLHARPNLAIGLYAGACLAIAIAIWRVRRQEVTRAFVPVLLPAITALGLMGAGGLVYLGMNEARFGQATEVHGVYTEDGVRYGSVFWGYEPPLSRRAEAFIEHGRFNVRRIVPNAIYYTAQVPTWGPLRPAARAQLDVYRAWTQPILGWIRVEPPFVGIAFVWAGWAALAAIGVVALRRRPLFAALLVGTGAAAILTLAYGTVTFRYRIDMWPALMTLALPGLALLAARFAPRPATVWGLVPIFAVGIAVSAATTASVSNDFVTQDGGFFGDWSREDCAGLARTIGFAETAIPRLCREPLGAS